MVNLINQKTGITWHYSMDHRGNVVLSKLPETGGDYCLVNPSVGRKAAHLAILVNGLPVNIWSEQLALDSGSTRSSEISALWNCEQSWPETRILAGDFNMQPQSTEYYTAAANHIDGWPKAKSLGTAVNYSGNCDGCTRNSRIDYIWLSKGSTHLSVKSAQIYDTRDANGIMPSDHKPWMVVFNVN
jgi:endonuclease/exonuclease/phosphatase family metal-dependent hydrolase